MTEKEQLKKWEYWENKKAKQLYYIKQMNMHPKIKIVYKDYPDILKNINEFEKAKQNAINYLTQSPFKGGRYYNLLDGKYDELVNITFKMFKKYLDTKYKNKIL